MLSHHFYWDLTHEVLFLYILPPNELERPALKMRILWCRSDICSCKLSAKVSLMLDNPFPLPSLCKFNHISVCFIQISSKITSKTFYSLQGKPFFFLIDPRCFGPLDKFQHNIKISIKTTRVSRPSFCFL